MNIKNSTPPSSHADYDEESARDKSPSSLSKDAEVHTEPTTVTDDTGEPYIVPAAVDTRPDYSALSESQRSFLLIVASLAATISPASTTTYYPAITALARDLNVSVALMNLTISTYQIFQGLAPSVTAAFSDRYGRRPAYILCLAINFGANLGLALQNDYSNLMVLRCLQSSGSSGTIALGQAVLDDLTTSDQRGKFLAYLSIGTIMGPALGPVIGGLLSQYLGWRAIFWFLTILGGVLMIVITIFFGETNRAIVGDGSNPPQKWNYSIFQLFRKNDLVPNSHSLEKRVHGVNPLKSLRILAGKENFIVCVYIGLLFAGSSAMTACLASQLPERYNYNEVQVGLCYLPIGIGSLVSRWTVGKLIDKKLQREAVKQGVTIVKNRKQDLSNQDVEKSRLIIAFPMILATCTFVLAFGWLLEYKIHISAVLISCFLLANVLTSALVAITALLSDINMGNGASLGAAMNLVRCLIGAGAVAAVTPLIDLIGIGFAATIIAAIWIAALPALWLVYRKGYQWRKTKAALSDQESEATEASAAPPVNEK
ncbi:hypothetical protein VMCG_01539 [Cytospora schulzeri]|uniref:Major facilitator superfamily (MFS) profile domain-containing protein n=1 Tax=Cytospora schulzeri TaxID=448051 RepID=A0A423X683_9PEZI|nr:hypothetical protein VMCG_01539 [Valsa malicola]